MNKSHIDAALWNILCLVWTTTARYTQRNIAANAATSLTTKSKASSPVVEIHSNSWHTLKSLMIFFDDFWCLWQLHSAQFEPDHRPRSPGSSMWTNNLFWTFLNQPVLGQFKILGVDHISTLGNAKSTPIDIVDACSCTVSPITYLQQQLNL